MNPFKVFRDEADLQVSTDETAKAKGTTEDESQEDDKKPAEDAEETVTDDVEAKSDDSEDSDKESDESDEDDDQFTDDEEEYIGQFGLPDDIKTTHEAIQYLVKNQGKTEEATKLAQLEDYLKGKGYTHGVDGLLQGTGMAPPQPQTGQQTGTFVSAVDTLNKNSGSMSAEEKALFMPLAEQQDETTRILGETVKIIYDEVQALKQGSQTITSQQNDIAYRNYAKESKKSGIRAFSKIDLDTAMKKMPGKPTYLEAQAFLIYSDPNKFQHQLQIMTQKAKKKAFKEFRRNKGNKFPKGKGRDKTSHKVFADYLGRDGQPTAAFYKLPGKEQDRLTDKVIAAAK